MLRIRIPGGRVEVENLEAILHFAKKSKASIILTSRAQIELHNLSFIDVIKTHKGLEKKGITSFQTLTDNIRNIITDPLDGIGKSSIIETYPLILKMQNIFLKKREFIGLIPRKFNTAISANIFNIVSFFSNDCYFALAKRGNIFGFNLYLGGKNSSLSKDANIFVKKEEVVELFEAVIKAYKKYGLRESRSKARLYHLIEKIGLEEFKERIKEFYKKDFTPKGKLISEKYINKDDFFELKNSKFAYRFKTKFGEIDKESLEEILKIAKRDNLKIRIGADQNLYIINLKDRYFPISPLSQNQNTVVCAGERYCIFSLFDTKKEAFKLILEKINSLNIKIGYSGCLKGCARHILCDIGFVGIRTTLYGKLQKGVRVYLGGEYTKGEKVARLIYWAVPLSKLNMLLEIIIDEFQNSGFNDFEDFSKNILNLYEEKFLAFYFLAKLKTKKRVYLGKSQDELFKEFINEDFIKEDIYKTIIHLEKVVYSS